ncbi:MAG: beta-galactosidase trimerization domain-containing protein [Runella sp.]
MIHPIRRLLFLTLFFNSFYIFGQNDPYFTQLYDSLHDSPMQQKFRRIAPMPAGVVYVQAPNEGEREMRQHFQTMKRLGFNALKQIMPLPTWTIEQISLIALEEGIIPWWYGEGGYEEITDALLQKLGIDKSLPMSTLLQHPKMIDYQKSVLKRRIERTQAYIEKSPDKKFMRVTSVAFDPEIGGRGVELTEKGEKLFLEWLKQRYQTVENLNRAWNQYHAGLFLNEHRLLTDWDDVARNWRNITGREYNHVKDIYRFKVEHNLKRIEESAKEFNAFDPQAPYRGGGELAVFHPFAWYSVDMEGIADVLKKYGSFYPSMHFSWHYNLVKGEVTKSLYQQAALMNDFNKGGWTGGWESTGGPQQLDGEKNPGHENSYYVGEGEVMQLYLSQLAAGFKGFGIWCWNPRTAGKEGGEYSLLDRNGQLTDRAVAIGKLGQAMQKYRFELWNAHKEPLVGVLYDWENEATWAAMSIPGREDFRFQPVKARIGISNWLIENNVPYEYVTPKDLSRGLAPRYKVIYLPAMLSIRKDLLPILKKYVEQGGRLVMDLPSGWYDEQTVLLPTGKGSDFEQLFGASIDDFQYSGTNRSQTINGNNIKGFTFNATATRAGVMARYDNGKPAIMENALGKGKAVLLGFQASLLQFDKQNTLPKPLLRQWILGTNTSPYTCSYALVYRLSSPEADHYFLLNEGAPKTVSLNLKSYKYKRFTDAISGENVNLSTLKIEAKNGRWIRAEK